MARLKVLMVGAGYFGRLHLDAWMAHPRAEVVGIVDPAAGTHETASIFNNLSAALTVVSPDLVDIATPPGTHLALVRRAMEVGIDAVCQKPFCGGLDAAREALAAVPEGKMLAVHENFRFQPWYRRIAELIAEGRLGEVHGVTFRLRPGDGNGPDAYRERQPYFRNMPRFLVHETGVHLVDTFRFLLGEPDWVWADLRRLNPAIRGEDAGHVVLGFPNGTRALLDANRLVDHAAQNTRRTMGEAWIDGSKATVTLDGNGRLLLREHGRTESEDVSASFDPDTFGGGCVAAFQDHVVRHLLDGAPLETRAVDYLRNMEIVEAIYASAARGARVELNDR